MDTKELLRKKLAIPKAGDFSYPTGKVGLQLGLNNGSFSASENSWSNFR